MAEPRGAVLVVEDDPDVREAIVDLIAGEGFEVHHAANGRKGLEALRAGLRPGVVLLDVRMPDMDGITFCEELRKDPALMPLNVVMMSADRHIKIPDRCGVETVLEKPIELEELFAVVRRYCG